MDASSWEGRYYAMEGRHKRSQVTIGSMQEQMAELGDELVRTQQAVPRRQQQQPQQPSQQQRLLTDADVQTYGPELIDVVKRAAREAIAPDIQHVQNQNRNISQQVTKQNTAGLYAALDAHVPDWKAVNVNPRFKAWCRSSDIYSGNVRGQLLNAAFQAADAPRVIAFFNGFLAEEAATGQAPTSQPEPGATPPRQAAVQLDTLTAPGRAKPATGDTAVASADKPLLTRAQVAGFYDRVRKGSYVGRDTDKARDEATIFAAQRDGRIR